MSPTPGDEDPGSVGGERASRVPFVPAPGPVCWPDLLVSGSRWRVVAELGPHARAEMEQFPATGSLGSLLRETSASTEWCEVGWTLGASDRGARHKQVVVKPVGPVRAGSLKRRFTWFWAAARSPHHGVLDGGEGQQLEETGPGPSPSVFTFLAFPRWNFL